MNGAILCIIICSLMVHSTVTSSIQNAFHSTELFLALMFCKLLTYNGYSCSWKARHTNFKIELSSTYLLYIKNTVDTVCYI